MESLAKSIQLYEVVYNKLLNGGKGTILDSTFILQMNRVVFEETLSTTQIKDLVNVPALAVHFY